MSVTFAFYPPEGDQRSVLVRFVRDGAVVHERHVNAVYTDGVYDEDATEARIEDVARGVVNKLESGTITPISNESTFKPITPPDDGKKLSAAEKKAKAEALAEAEAKAEADRLALIAAREAAVLEADARAQRKAESEAGE